MHWPEHQKGTDLVSKGNQLADQTAKQAAREMAQELVTLPVPALPEKPDYSEEDLKYLQKWTKLGYEGDWAKTRAGKLILPRTLGKKKLVSQIHQGTHLGTRKLKELMGKQFQVSNLERMAQDVVDKYTQCQAVNAGGTRMGRGKRERGREPRIYWEVDFTEMKQEKHKYILVFVDTFSGWVEAFFVKHETAGMVVKNY